MRSSPMLWARPVGAVLLGPALVFLLRVPEVAAQAVRPEQGLAATEVAEPAHAPRDGGMVLAYPTGDRASSTLLVEVAAPSRMAVGHAYNYQIRVTNLTKGLTLEDVGVHQTTGESLAIESSEPKLDKPERVEARYKPERGEARWTIPRLGPGETATIKVTALGEKEGRTSSCIRVTYEPTLCVVTEFIKPEVQVTKEAPKSVDICDPITFRYVVKNTGSGAIRGLRLRDELPRGLTTADGKQVVATEIGDLAEGRAKEVTVKLAASQVGDFTSRAVAEGQDELRAQSNQTTTAVRQPKLTVNITGPEAEYMDQRVTYQVTVKNEGEAPARRARLQVQADRNAKVLRVSKTSLGAAAPTIDGNTLTWDLGDLGPGQSDVVSLTTVARVARAKAEQKHVATASHACPRGGDFARSTTASIATEVLTIPALLLELVDKQDPVQVGANEVYTIVVLNQGEGEDRDVKVVCRLPEGLTYVDSSGPTKATADGQTVTFRPIDRLEPKEKATWTVTAKATKAGDVRTKVELTSEYLTTPVRETEPTRLIE
ncbi:MAG: CARDB domain-containing protein [Planctomycetaceae bacterium]